MHAQHGDVREKIAGGDWSDGTQEAVKQAVETFASDFGYDLDEEGHPLDDDAPPAARRDQAATADDAPEPEAEQREEEPQPA